MKKKLFIAVLLILVLVPLLVSSAYASTGIDDVNVEEIAATAMIVISIVLLVVALLAAVVGAIVQVTKNMFANLPTNGLAFVVSQVVTLIAFFAVMAISKNPIEWYYVAGAVVLGFFVAFSSMFGFDKLQQLLTSWKNKKTSY